MSLEIVARAETIARIAHTGQKYAGEDFFDNHLVPVRELLKLSGYGLDYQAAGLLHDVIEDTEETAESLLAKGIPRHVVEAVVAVSKIDGQTHEEYLEGIMRNPLAVAVKFCDSTYNLSTTLARPHILKPEKFLEWSTEYQRNRKELRDHLPQPCDGRSLAQVAFIGA